MRNKFLSHTQIFKYFFLSVKLFYTEEKFFKFICEIENLFL